MTNERKGGFVLAGLALSAIGIGAAPAASSSPASYTMTLDGQTVAQGSDVVCRTSTNEIDIFYGAGIEDHSGRFSIKNPKNNPELQAVSLTVFDPTAQRPGNDGLGFSEEWEYGESNCQ
jgi:hypothetical protein